MDVDLQRALRNLKKDPMNAYFWDEAVIAAKRHGIWVWVTGVVEAQFTSRHRKRSGLVLACDTAADNHGELVVYDPDAKTYHEMYITDVERFSLDSQHPRPNPKRKSLDEEWRELQRQYETSQDPKILKTIEIWADRKGRKFDLARKYLADLKREERVGPIILEHERMVELLGLPEWTKLAENNIDTFTQIADQSTSDEDDEDNEDDEDAGEDMSDGYGERETPKQKRWDAAYQEAEKELYNQWKSAVDRVITTYCEYHNMDVKFQAKDDKVILSPEDNWTDTAIQIVRTINGVGYFTYGSVSEFVRIGPFKSARHAVEKHLHWMKDYGSVYGELSPSRLYQRLGRNPAFRRG